MNACAQASHMNDLARRKLSLTPDLSPVIAGPGEEKPFKRLHVLACADTRLKSGVNEK
jgi:hypothetical protein